MNNRIAEKNIDLVSNYEDTFFYHLFQHSMIGQAIVNKNMNILFANNQIFQCFQLKDQDSAGLSFGSAFHCVKLRNGGHKCGEGENCKKCGIWRSVRQTLFDDAPVQNVIQFSFQTEHHSVKKWFQLNCGKVTRLNEQYAALGLIDISAMKQKERHLRTKLTLDLATGMLNKTSLTSALRQLTSGKVVGNFTICMIDFDHFKVINDRYGHLMGDHVLEVFSDIARSHIRNNDIIGRYGGEEFIFVFQETDQIQSLQILKRIYIELAECFSKEMEIPVAFSAGAVQVRPESGRIQYTELLGEVDKMLYHAKKQGRGRAMCSMGEILFTETSP